MAQAVKRLYPQTKLAYGPANEKGFYYDLDLGDTRLTDSDLPAIEAEMKKIVKGVFLTTKVGDNTKARRQLTPCLCVTFEYHRENILR